MYDESTTLTVLCTTSYAHTTNNINGLSGENMAIRKLWESLVSRIKEKKQQ